MLEQEQDREDIVYHIDTTSIGIELTQFNVCFSWQDPLEEPSNSEVNPHIEKCVFEMKPT